MSQILSGRRLETLAMAMTGPHLFDFIKWPSIGFGNDWHRQLDNAHHVQVQLKQSEGDASPQSWKLRQ